MSTCVKRVILKTRIQSDPARRRVDVFPVSDEDGKRRLGDTIRAHGTDADLEACMLVSEET